MLLQELNSADAVYVDTHQYRLMLTKNERIFFEHIKEDMQDLKNEYIEHNYIEESGMISTDVVEPPKIINTVQMMVFDNKPVSLKELIKKYKKSYPVVEDPDDIEQFLEQDIVDIMKLSYYPSAIYKQIISSLIKRYISSFKLNKFKIPKDVVMVTMNNNDKIKQFKNELKKSVKIVKGDDIKSYWNVLSKLVLETEEDDGNILTHISTNHFNPATTRLLKHVITLKEDDFSLVEYHKALNELKHQLTDDYMHNNDHINELLKQLINVPKQYKNSPDVISIKNKITNLKHQNSNLIHAGGHSGSLTLTWVMHYNHLQDELLKHTMTMETSRLNELYKKLNQNSAEHVRLKNEIFKIFDKMLNSEKPKNNDILLKGFNYYKKFKDNYVDDLNDKHIIILDDKVKEYHSDVIKTMYFCGVIPKSIMIITM